jgi:hypothetical protein
MAEVRIDELKPKLSTEPADEWQQPEGKESSVETAEPRWVEPSWIERLEIWQYLSPSGDFSFHAVAFGIGKVQEGNRTDDPDRRSRCQMLQPLPDKQPQLGFIGPREDTTDTQNSYGALGDHAVLVRMIGIGRHQ